MEVVFQRLQSIVIDFSVRAIEVGSMDRSALQPSIGQVMIHAEDILLREPVTGAQAGPAVTPVHELVAEAEDQFRMRPQV